MKRSLIIILCSIAPISVFAQGKIKGKVVYLNSGKKPASGVEVKAEGSNGDYSKTDGAYTLQFPSKKAGHTVKIEVGNEIILNGNKTKKIEVVNTEKITAVNIPTNLSSYDLKIIVCPAGARNTAAQHYYKIIKTSSEKVLAQKKQELATLRDKLGTQNELVKQLQKELQVALAQNDTVYIYKQAMEYASVNKDDATQRLKKFIEALDADVPLEIALKLLDTKKAFQEAQESNQQLEAAIEEIRKDAEGLIQLYQYPKALQKYDTIALIYRDHKRYKDEVDLLCDLGIWCARKHNDTTALSYYNRGLKNAIRYGFTYAEANFCYNIAYLYQEQQQFAKAEDYYTKSLRLSELLERDTTQTKYRDLLALTNTYLGVLYTKTDSTKALSHTKKAIAIYRKLAEKDSSYLSNVGRKYLQLTEIYKINKEYEKAANSIEEYLLVAQKLSKENNENEAILNNAKVNALWKYTQLLPFANYLSKIEDLSVALLPQYEQLSFEEQRLLLLCLFQQTIYYYEDDKEQKGNAFLEKQLPFWRKFMEEYKPLSDSVITHSNREAFDYTQMKIADKSFDMMYNLLLSISRNGYEDILYNDFEEMEEQEKNIISKFSNDYEKNIKELRELCKENPKRYRVALAEALSNDAVSFDGTLDSIKVEEYYKEAIPLYTEIIKDTPAYNEQLLSILNKFSDFYYHIQRNKTKSKFYWDKAYIFAKDCLMENPTQRNIIEKLKEMIYTQHNRLHFEREKSKRTEFLLSTLKDIKTLQTNPSLEIKSVLLQLNTLLAELYESKPEKNTKEIERYYLEALNITEELEKNRYPVNIKKKINLWLDLGNLYYFKLENYEKAREYYEAAIEYEDNDQIKVLFLPLYYENLGYIYYSQQKYYKSFELYKKSLSLYAPNNPKNSEKIKRLKNYINYIQTNKLKSQ